MEQPAVAYMCNRPPQLAIAMASAAAITMPRGEEARRGSLEDTFAGSTTRGPVETVNEVTVAAMTAAAGAAQGAILSETMIQHSAFQIGSHGCFRSVGTRRSPHKMDSKKQRRSETFTGTVKRRILR